MLIVDMNLFWNAILGTISENKRMLIFRGILRRITSIGSPVVTFRASDFADQIIQYGEIIFFETQGQAGLKPWISHKQIAKQ